MRSHRRRTRVTHERWLVSYADFITLLFAFFVVLYAIDKSKERNESDVSSAINSAFQALGVLPSFALRPGTVESNDVYVPDMRRLPEAHIVSAEGVRENLEQIRRQLAHALSTQISQHIVSLQLGPDGLVISLHEAGFFSSGSATPLPQTLNTLKVIGASLRETRYNVRVEGHTDNVPIHNERFASNWELSAIRATVITRMLLGLHCVPPERLSAAGYGEFRPIVSNATAAERAENRRVDLVVFPRVRLNMGPNKEPAANGRWQTITAGDSPVH